MYFQSITQLLLNVPVGLKNISISLLCNTEYQFPFSVKFTLLLLSFAQNCVFRYTFKNNNSTIHLMIKEHQTVRKCATKKCMPTVQRTSTTVVLRRVEHPFSIFMTTL